MQGGLEGAGRGQGEQFPVGRHRGRHAPAHHLDRRLGDFTESRHRRDLLAGAARHEQQRFHSDSVVQGNRLLISGLMLELDVEKPAARVVWPERLTGTGRILSRTSSPVLQGGHVYSARSSGELVCLDAATGQQIWGARTVTRLRNGSSIHLTPCGDAMFLFSDAGDLIRARLTPQGYHEISRAHLLEPTTPFGAGKCAWTPPAYAHGHVYARNDEELVCASLTAAP